jgi:hypothetical protein
LRSATTKITGTSNRKANTAAPRGVLAGRPKNGTNVDARPITPWSATNATARPARSERGVRLTASESWTTVIPISSRV